MWIRARTIDGKRSVQIDDISKLTKIEDLRVKLDKEFGIPPEKQRLFFAGKQVQILMGILYLFFILAFSPRSNQKIC